VSARASKIQTWSHMASASRARRYCSLEDLFNHLVGSGEQRRWNREAEHPGGLVVDDKLEFGRLHDWQIRRLRAFEDAASRRRLRRPVRRSPANGIPDCCRQT
jgi:hypothetical protein